MFSKETGVNSSNTLVVASTYIQRPQQQQQQQQETTTKNSTQNLRLINTSSDLIRIKSQLTDMQKSKSFPICNPYLCQVLTCDPYAKVLMEKALESTLSRRDQQIVLNELLKKPSFIHEINLAPHKLPGLIEHNPLISFEILLKLVNRIDDTLYYEILLNIPLSMNYLEVMNRLCTTIILPLEIVKIYIRNIIEKCEKICGERLKARYIRLICIFLQHIVRNKIYKIHDIYFDILAFCVRFYQINESANLWCLIQRLETIESQRLERIFDFGKHNNNNNNNTLLKKVDTINQKKIKTKKSQK